MTTIYTWSITSMDAYPQADGEQDVVFNVNWSCFAIEDENYQATSFGSVPVTYAAGSPYTPYNQLTQEQVWGWINPSIDRPAVEANLQSSIDAQKTPEVVTPPIPWSN